MCAEQKPRPALSRRAFLRGASLAAFGSVTAACNLVPGQENSAALSWWPGWPGPYMQGVVDKFRQSHPTVKVNTGLFYPTGEKLLTAIAAGNAPDLVADLPYYNFIGRGLCVALDDMIAASNEISLTDGDIRTANWDAFKWGDKHYGIPAADTAGRQAIGYNLDLLHKAGLDANTLPETWEEVFDWHKRLTTFDRAGNLQILGIDPIGDRAGATSDGDTWLWPEMWGFHYFDHKNLTYDIDRPETVEFFETILRFYDHVGVTKMAGLSTSLGGRPQGAFGQGRQVMSIAYPAGPAEVFDADPKQKFTFTWVPVPASRKGKRLQTVAGHASLLMASSKHQTEAFQLAVFLTQKQACDVFFDNVGWIGPRKSWQKTLDLGKYPEHVQKNILFYTNSIDEANDLWVVDKDPEDSFLSDQWNQAIGKVTHHDITPQEAARFLQTQLTDDLTSERREFSARAARSGGRKWRS